MSDTPLERAIAQVVAALPPCKTEHDRLVRTFLVECDPAAAIVLALLETMDAKMARDFHAVIQRRLREQVEIAKAAEAALDRARRGPQQ
jgi:hypothetical protein